MASRPARPSPAGPATYRTYQPALDGLRAIAVYGVLAFHAGVPLASGGFVGVDLFLVLSGFLVGGLLLAELDTHGRVRLWRFYGRRVRRLLPAALLVVVATSAAFVLVAPAIRRAPLVGDAQASLLYVANWRFLSQENDYFGGDVDRSPFLHFWSLSIEEQFYLLLPLLLIVLWRVSRRRQGAIVVSVAVLLGLSLAAQVWWAGREPGHAYYGTDARAYQLLAGVLLARWVRRRAPDATDDAPDLDVRRWSAYGAGGLALLALTGSSLLDVGASARGLAATVAAVVVVHATVRLHDRGLARPLGARAPAYLGRISYGTYLWHWPLVLVLGTVVDVGPWVVLLIAGVLATALAALSHVALETPIRSSRRLGRIPSVSVAVGLATSVLVAVAVVPPVLGSDRKPALVAGDRSLTSEGRQVPDVDWSRLADDNGPDDILCTPDDVDQCIVARGGSGPRVMLVGDSHARVVAPAITQLADEHDFTLALDILVGCPWQRRSIRPDDRLGAVCEDNRDDVYDTLLEEMDIDVVVLAQQARDRGRYYDDAARTGMSEAELDRFNYDTMQETVAAIKRAGATAVMIEPMLTVPEGRADPLECLSGATRTSECAVPVPLEPPPSTSWVKAIALTSEAADSITVNDLLCPDAPVCDPLVCETPVWFDRRHFTPAAVSRYADQIWARLSGTSAFGGTP